MVVPIPPPDLTLTSGNAESRAKSDAKFSTAFGSAFNVGSSAASATSSIREVAIIALIVGGAVWLALKLRR